MTTPLRPEQLRNNVNPMSFAFETTAELSPVTRIIGQSRGVAALDFGINIDSPGYNIYVLGQSNTGRAGAIEHYLKEHAAGRAAPSDWVYVHNFREPDKPVALRLPQGMGCQLRDALSQRITQLRTKISDAFDNQAFRDAALETRHEMEAAREKLFDNLKSEAVSMGAVLLRTPEGFTFTPGVDGRPFSPEEAAQMSAEQQAAWRESLHALEHRLNEAIYQARKLEGEAKDALDDLVRRVTSSVVDVELDALTGEFDAFENVKQFIDEVRQDVLDNVHLFRDSETSTDDAEEDDLPEQFRHYRVNVIIDHKYSTSAPVVVEYNPTVPRLLGRVDHEARPGGVRTDFTLLRGGALHEANGGYLLLRAGDLSAEPGAWEALKRALVSGTLRPDDPATRSGMATRSLDAEPILLDLKVVLLGPPELYYMLRSADDDFRPTFKVMADFDEMVPRSEENELDYATFIATSCVEEGLPHFNREAVARVIEFGSRHSGSQKKLTARFGKIADLVRESAYWAQQASRDLVTLADVVSAIDHRNYRSNRVETQLRESLADGKQLIATEGDVVGQINALSVSRVGEHTFGQATRVTARTYVGKQGVVQIDREVELAGPIHNKGLMTLVGYLGGQYADDQPLTLSAQITFEQNYGGIEGDSAASTELYALLSSLAGLPIRQSIAVTGSVNQRGKVQPIGGATAKIEGWFEVCKLRGLTGEQGVLIPASNVGDLMLRDEVVAAVSESRFHIWAVDSIDEGIALLTGRPAAETHAATKARLRELALSGMRFEEDRKRID